MRSGHAALERGEGGPPLLKAAVAGLAVLGAAALAAGLFDGPLPQGAPGRAVFGLEAGLAVVGGRGPGPAALQPVSRLCFHGPRGEPVDFPAVQHCP